MFRSKRHPISKAGDYEASLREYYCATHVKHAGNKPEYFGKPFFLEPFQRDNIWRPIFGTGRMVGKGEDRRFVRRYQSALIGLPRDFGKTELICAMLLTETGVNPVPMGQYGIVAYSKTQARKILATLGMMIRQDDDLRALWDVGKVEIENRENGAVIQVFPYSEGALQSWHFNFLIADELHVWRDTSVWNAIVSGMGNIENSLVMAITTASGSRSGFLWDWIEGTEDIVSVLEDPASYCWWWGAADGDAIDDRRVWRKLALPSWVTVENIERQRRKLSKRNFERYILNRFPVEDEPDKSFRPRDLKACAKIGGDVDFSEPFALAIDGAVRGDAFAIVAHQERDGTHYFHEWVYDSPPEDTGYYDLAQIGQLVAGLSQRYGCPVGIDPARLLLWASVLQDEYGVEIYEIKQTNQIMCPACSLVVNAVTAHRAALGDCPRLADHLANCLDADREPYGTRFTSSAHGQGSHRIDAAIAAAMAMWMTQSMPPREKSFAETGGVWSIEL